MSRLRDWLAVLTTPLCWGQNYALSEAWDRELTRLLDTGHVFTRTGRYTATIGTIEVWTGNHPYASFTVGDRVTVRPRRTTLLRAARRVDTNPTTYERTLEPAPQCRCERCR